MKQYNKLDHFVEKNGNEKVKKWIHQHKKQFKKIKKKNNKKEELIPNVKPNWENSNIDIENLKLLADEAEKQKYLPETLPLTM